MHVAIASDHRGYSLKAKVISLMQEWGHQATDFGPENGDTVDYPDYAARVAQAVSQGEVDRGVLLCGTGIGMCIVANKFPGVRAADCFNDLSVEMARRHHDANILCLPADLLGGHSVDRMLELFLVTSFEEGRHTRRLDKISDLERQACFLAVPERAIDID